MKITCFVLCILGLAALAAADSEFGQFVPKTFYKLDAEGHKSNIVEINPHQANILRRLRRQSSFSGSSSSTSSSSSSFGSNGGPVYFTSHQVVQHTPDLASRFGGDYGSTGKVVSSTGVIDNGRVVYHKTKTENL